MNCADVATIAPLFLSGELDAERAEGVSMHLRTCAVCAREIEQQRDLDARVRSALLAEMTNAAALQPRIRRHIAVAEAKRRVLALALLAAAMVLAAGFLFQRFAATPASRLAMDAVQDHRREVVEKRVKKWRSDIGEIDALAGRQAIPASAIRALAAAGYRLDRARMCRLNGDLYLHLVYQDGAREISVFLRPRQGQLAPPRAQSVGPEYVVAMQSTGMTVLCVSDERRAAMKLANSAAAAL